jgi:CheY-like chemotaxis protein
LLDDMTLMTSTLFWLLLGLGAALAGWRIATSRRRNAGAARSRENAAQTALLAARKAVLQGAPMHPAPTAAPTPPAAVPPDAEAMALARATARAKAERVIAAEAARRQAAIRKAQNVARAEAERRAAEAAEEARALAATIPLHSVPTPVARVAAASPLAAPSPIAPIARSAEAANTSTNASTRLPAHALCVDPVMKTAGQTLILVVDDSRMVRVKTSRLLTAHGFQVVTAVDGLDAIKQLETCSPDIVITDVDMPGMDGFGLARHLRGNAGTRRLPIVMITSAEDRHREEALGVGVGLMLGKPYPEDELVGYIRSFDFVATVENEPAFALA